MTLAALSLPVVALALFLGTGWVAGAALFGTWLRVVAARPHRARHTPLVAALPWLVGGILAVGAVVPGDPHSGRVLACHCLESMPAWLHLCPVHPEEAAGLAFPAVLVLAALLPGRARALAALLREPLGQGGGARPRVVALGAPTALLTGWLRPTLVVDRALWAALSPEERSAMLAHERGHLRRRDPLVRVLLQAALALAPAALYGRVMRAWLDHAELSADAEAARIVGDPGAVAQALLRCARLGVRAPALEMAWSGGTLERRVHALLDGSAPAVAARADLGPRELAILLGLAAGALATTPWVHHQVEHLLNLPL